MAGRRSEPPRPAFSPNCEAVMMHHNRLLFMSLVIFPAFIVRIFSVREKNWGEFGEETFNSFLEKFESSPSRVLRASDCHGRLTSDSVGKPPSILPLRPSSPPCYDAPMSARCLPPPSPPRAR